MSDEINIMDGGWDNPYRWVVIHSNRHGDGGWRAGTFQFCSITFARANARERDCEMSTTRIINLAEVRG